MAFTNKQKKENVATKAPADTSEEDSDNKNGSYVGCESVIGGGAMAVVLAAAMVWIKKREEK